MILRDILEHVDAYCRWPDSLSDEDAQGLMDRSYAWEDDAGVVYLTDLGLTEIRRNEVQV